MIDGKQEGMFRARMDHFLKTWAPDDPREKRAFEIDLFSLMRGLSIDMSEGYGRVVSAHMAVQPLSMMIVPADRVTGFMPKEKPNAAD